MFTGLIEQVGEVLECRQENHGIRLTLSLAFDQLQVGESIAVNGVCLTLLPSDEKTLAFDISPETSRITTIGDLQAGDKVNLERSMVANSRFGGHYVSGHVDTTALIKSIESIGECTELVVSSFTKKDILYLIPKGSITVDGVSLTINDVLDGQIKLMLIPHTLAHTSLCNLKAGQKVNIEFDYFTRIVAHQLQHFAKLNHEVLQ